MYQKRRRCQRISAEMRAEEPHAEAPPALCNCRAKDAMKLRKTQSGYSSFFAGMQALWENKGTL
jgi:hypothetical protein